MPAKNVKSVSKKSPVAKPSRKPVVRKVAAPVAVTPAPVVVAATPKAAVAKPAPQSVAAAAKPAVTDEVRFQMIQKEAYLLAEKNGFHGDPNGFWHAAERRVAELLKR